jgi:hypothetical protein
MNKSTADILIEARDMISDPNDWCQGFMHRIRDDGEKQHCSLGAVEKVCSNVAGKEVYGDFLDIIKDPFRTLRKAAETIGIPGSDKSPLDATARFNDNSTHEEVMDLFDQAIRIAKDES